MYKMQMAVRYEESYTLLPQLLDATLTQDLREVDASDYANG
jgi:hypothetical protein